MTAAKQSSVFSRSMILCIYVQTHFAIIVQNTQGFKEAANIRNVRDVIRFMNRKSKLSRISETEEVRAMLIGNTGGGHNSRFPDEGEEEKSSDFSPQPTECQGTFWTCVAGIIVIAIIVGIVYLIIFGLSYVVDWLGLMKNSSGQNMNKW